MKLLPTIAFALTSGAALHAVAQAPNDSWTVLPDISEQDLTVMFRAVLVSSDALALSNGRSVLITYWRGGPRATYYRCVDYESPSFQSTGQTCWRLGPAAQ